MNLNLAHLHYFWSVAKSGSVTEAAKTLHVTPSTVSIQIGKLEDQVNQDLFQRVGRRLELTEVGRVAFRYADALFSTAQELENFFDGRRSGDTLRVHIGVAHIFPKLVTWHLLEPATQMDDPCHIVCREAVPRELVDELALHQLDVVFSDTPLKGSDSVRLYNRMLGESSLSFFATPDLVRKYKRKFPESMETCPILMPANGTEMRRSVDTWFSRHHLEPNIAAEFDDMALMKVAGEHGVGVFPVPDVVAEEAMDHYHVKRMGRMEGVSERFYVVTAERKIEHPVVQKIVSEAPAFLAGFSP